MRRFAALWVAVGCSGDATDGDGDGEHNGLAVRLEVDEVPEELSSLTVRVEEVVVEGEGPSGPASVVYDAGETLALVGGGAAAPLTLDLEVGPWRDAEVTVRLSALGGVPALAADGAIEDDLRLELRIDDPLDLADRGSFDLSAGVDAEVLFLLDPDAWLDELEDDELEDEGGVVRIDRTHNRAAYDAVRARIAATTEARFPGEEDPRDDSR